MFAAESKTPQSIQSAHPSFWLSLNPEVLSHFSVIFLYLAITLLMLDPLPGLAATHVRDMADPLEWSWVLGYGARQLLANPLDLFQGNVFYPFRDTLAFGESSVASIVLGAPIVWATDNPILAQNVLILASFVLAGYGTYLLVSDLTGSRLAGVVAGLIFAFCPYRMEKTIHLPFVSNQWLPLAFFALNRFLRGGRVRWAAVFGAFLATQFLTSTTLAFVTVFAVAAYLGVVGLARPSTLLRPRVSLPLLSAILLAGACLLLVSLPYFDVARRYDMLRAVDEVVEWSARPGSYLAPNPYQLLWGRVDALVNLGDWERHAFPGLLAILLALTGTISCVVGSRRHDWPWGTPSARPTPSRDRGVALTPTVIGVGFVAVGVVCFALSLGPISPRLPFVDFRLPSPYLFLYDHFPGFQSMRVAARFAIGVLLAVSVLAGVGAARLLRWAAERGAAGPRWRVALAVALAAVVLVEGWSAPPPLKPVPSGLEIPAVYRWLLDQPAKSAIVEYPISMKGDLQEEATYFAAFHGWKVVNGWRSFAPPGYGELADRLPEFRRRDALQTLANIGVRYVVVHEAPLDPGQIVEVRSNLDRWRGDVRLVAGFGSDRAYELLLPPEAQPVHVALEGDCDAIAGSQYAVDLVYRTPGTTVVGLTDPPEWLTLAVEWRVAGEGRVALARTLTIPGPDALLADGRASRLRVEAPNEAGVYELAIASLAPAVSPSQEIAAARTVVVRTRPAVGVAEPPILTGVRFLDPAKGEAEMADRSAGPDRPLRVEASWRARCPCECQDAVQVNVFDSGFRVWSSARGAVPADVARCLATEAAGTHEVSLPPDMPAGYYQAEIVLIDSATGERREFVAPSGERVTSYVAGRIRVYDPARADAERAEPTHASGAVLGERIALAGWGAAPESPRPGDDLRVHLFWQARDTLPADLSVFVHLYDASGRLVYQHDGPPSGGAWPTSSWRPGDTIPDERVLKLPPDLAPGRYALAVGVYDPATGRRLAVVGGDDLGDSRLLLAYLSISGR